MKMTTFLLSLLSLFHLLNGWSFAVIKEVTSTSTAVLDVDKNALRAGVDYYMLPVIRGRGGGVTMAASNNETCPLDQVIQHRFETNNGHSLKFSPLNSKFALVEESTDLNIEFSGATICVQSLVWRLGQYDECKKMYFLTLGGVKGNPGITTISNWFKIEKYLDDYYKLVFCPTVCDYCKVICKDVGIYYDENGEMRLGLTDDQPFAIMFKKA